jgi:adenylate cyclase
MSDVTEGQAWLETPAGDRTSLRTNCSIGRDTGNDVVIDSARASRRHAVIHLQNIGEFWLVDLGSTNGTFLNARRIPQPLRLCNDDQIMIGETVLKFCQPHGVSPDYQTTVAERTIRGMEHVGCWLLLADVEDFTPLSGQLNIEELAAVLGSWMAACKQIVEERGGSINKYLGDGILAYWRDDDASARHVADTIHAFKELQRLKNPNFRIVVHFGRVAIGGLVSMGEESLMGKEVNLVFRLEKLSGSLKEQSTVSAEAKAKLQELVSARSLGDHRLKGFDSTYELFAV